MFTDYSSVTKLLSLAKSPFDLTQEGALSPERLEKYHASSCGYQLFYGTERITDDAMIALEALAVEANVFEKMEKMQAGEVINRIEGCASENRSVLHCATRDFFENPHPSKAASDARLLAQREVEKLRLFIDKLNRENRFTDLVMIGIGGSYLGPYAHYLALHYLKKENRNVHFISNIDPDEAALVLRGMNLKSTLVLVVSKTGTTLETLANEEFLRARFLQAGLPLKDHFVSVSLKGSPLDNPEKYLECFYIWDWIGGRYSTSSMVGGVVLAFAFGFEVYWEMLKGANAMDKAALSRKINENLPLLAALLAVWNRTFLNYSTMALIPYSQALGRYVAHIQQVEMESSGKHIDKEGNSVSFETGPIIWGEPGTNAQHSFYQLIHQGTSIVPLEFIGFRDSQMNQDLVTQGTTSQQKLLANLFAQAIGLATGQRSDNPNRVFPGNRPSHLLLGKQLTPFALGALLAFYEHKVAYQGFIWNINSFDQEGVQLGKVLANKIIARFESQDNKSLEKDSSLEYPLGDFFLKQLTLI